MTAFWWLMASGLLLNIAGGLLLLAGRKGGVDSLLSALLMGTTGVGLVLVLGLATGQERAVAVALVFALLAAVLGVAFVQRAWPDADGTGKGDR